LSNLKSRKSVAITSIWGLAGEVNNHKNNEEENRERLRFVGKQRVWETWKKKLIENLAAEMGALAYRKGGKIDSEWSRDYFWNVTLPFWSVSTIRTGKGNG